MKFMKVIGTKKEKTPIQCLLEQEKIISELEDLSPYKKPKGIIIKFKSWSDLDKFNIERASKKI